MAPLEQVTNNLMASRTWTCQRVRNKVRCATKNPAIKQKCVTCGAPRPKRKREKHFSILDLPYEAYVMANGGSENCGICGAPPTTKRKNSRDHEHRADGLVRGLLCHNCNRVFGRRFDLGVHLATGGDVVEFLRRALVYFEHAERNRGMNWEAFLQ